MAHEALSRRLWMIYLGLAEASADHPFANNQALLLADNYSIQGSGRKWCGTIWPVGIHAIVLLLMGCLMSWAIAVKPDSGVMDRFGAAFFGLGVISLVMIMACSWTITINGDVIIVRLRVLFFNLFEFTEGIGGYTGVQYFSERVGGGRYWRTYHFLALVHGGDYTLTVPLWLSRSQPTNERLYDFASALGVPVLERTVTGTVATSAAMWGTPVQRKPFQIGIAMSDPPEELSRAEGGMGVWIKVARRPLASRGGPMIAIAGLVLPLMIAGAFTHWAVFALGVAVLGLGVTIVAYNETERRLFISPTYLRLERFGFGAWEPCWSVPHVEILSVEIVPESVSFDGPSLLINTRREHFIAGSGLALPTLNWLKDYLTTAIALNGGREPARPRSDMEG